MEDFNDIISNWKGQPVPDNSKRIAKAVKNKRTAQQLQRNTIIVLGATTVAVAIVAFASSGASALFYAGLCLMAFALLLRIAIELHSIIATNKIDVANGILQYASALKDLYLKRKRIHGLLTYLILALYAAGFCLMLPTFKLSLPAAFYTYIIVCGIILLPVLAIFITIMNRKELKAIAKSISELAEVESELK